MSQNNTIEITNLSKKYEEYGSFKLEIDNLVLPKGSILGFIGRNGAGKTTTIKLMLNQLKKDEGEIKILGLDSEKNEISIKEDVGVVLAENHFPENFTTEIIKRIMKNVYKNWDSEVFDAYLKRFELDQYKKIKTMSRGMQMKVNLAVALSHNPKLLILDEPTGGLDPVARAELMDMFYDFTANGENSIFFSTHITSDLDRIADYITLIDDGKILLSISKPKLDEEYGLVKCSEEEAAIIPEELVLGKRQTDFFTEFLVNDRRVIEREHPQLVVDKILIEDLMTYTDKQSEEKRK